MKNLIYGILMGGITGYIISLIALVFSAYIFYIFISLGIIFGLYMTWEERHSEYLRKIIDEIKKGFEKDG